MSESWCEIHIHIPAAAVDLVCAELGELGCSGVTVEERRLDTFTPPDPDEPLVGPVRLRAYFDVEGAGVEALRLAVYERLRWLAPMFPGLEAHLPEVATVRNEDWAEGWKQHFPLVHIGRRLVIRPSWEEYSPVGAEVVVVLDPGMAFGTGTHGTTRLCLEALATLFETPCPPRRVLDVGTGSGILAIAAAALGAERVLACDIEAESCRIARENVRNNGLQNQVEVTGALLEELEGDFDLVLANILAEENIRLADPLVSRVRPGGTLVLSGILQEKEALVATAFKAQPLNGPQFFRSDDWSCLVYGRNR
jgi:ribosomal protein L11 methyltransferase